MTQTIIPEAIIKIESEKDKDFERDNAIDLLITENYMVSTLKTLTGLRFLVISSIYYFYFKRQKFRNT